MISNSRISPLLATMEMWDTVVLGLGGIGSFALRAVSKETKNVLGIERFARAHSKGSSHGQSRIYRKAYFENPDYVPWINFSLKEFLKLQTETNTSIVNECGMLLVEEEAKGELLEVSLASAKRHNVPIECLGVGELRERFPQFRYSEGMVGVFEPGAGFLRPERAIRAALQQAEENEATIWENTVVKSLQEIPSDASGKISHVEILVQHYNGEEELILAKSVLVAAGSWTSEIIPSFAPHLRVIRQLQTWVDVSSLDHSSIYDSGNMPCFAISTPEWPLALYGIPVDSQCDGERYRTSIKFGIHGRNQIVDPNLNPPSVSHAELEEIKGAGRSFLNSRIGDLTIKDTVPCMYTMTKDQDFIVGVPEGYEKVCVVGGLSGHGFKMSPALGQILADFALERDLKPWNGDFCSPARFGV
jgi:sarcosine oxidase